MGARVIQLAEARARRRPKSDRQTVKAYDVVDASAGFHFWSGASGQRYVHTVYDLLDCPEVPAANFLLVHRDAVGHRSILAIGHLKNQAPSLNLAEIRHRAARLGANEVHIHLLAPSAHDRRTVELDLRAGGIDAEMGTPIAATRH